MNSFGEFMIQEIKKHVADGATPTEALEKVGARPFAGSDVYCIPYGLYEDKVLLFKINKDGAI